MTWQPMTTAKKDLKPILLKLKNTLSADYKREDLKIWDGLVFVGRHIGLADDGFDIGWIFAAPVGAGGFPDEWFVGWQPIPE